ncbi:MAG: hypothetical protein M3Y22_14865 [Pseudomonadota bacterium]|nr:hypothetical protein [Pseudomonadota bacterium]
MDGVPPFDRERPLPDLSVVEFAIMLALLRHGPVAAPIILPTLSEWFAAPLGLSHIEPKVTRLIRAGYVRDERGLLFADQKARDTVVSLYVTLFRILGGDITKMLSLDNQFLDDLLKKGD